MGCLSAWPARLFWQREVRFWNYIVKPSSNSGTPCRKKIRFFLEEIMSAGSQGRAWNGPSRRHGSRFLVRAPMDVTVLRSGIPDTLPGRSLNLSERGLAAILAGDLLPGETVGVEIRLPMAADSLRARALVRHQESVCCGMEFLSLSPEQQAAIRHWAELSKAPIAPEIPSAAVHEAPDPAVDAPDLSAPADSR